MRSDNLTGAESKEVKDLIAELLNKNPAQRITCSQAMEQQWFEAIRESQGREEHAKGTGVGVMAKDEFVEVTHSIRNSVN